MDSTEKGNNGEIFVNNIAYNSFLKYWCYPSPKDEKGDKKEICDLLIIFNNTAIIISVKNYQFKENYSQYFRKTIDKAVRQIYGAERKLFSIYRDTYIKHPDRSLEKFPKENIKQIFRIIVNLGEGVKFYPLNKETKSEEFISLFDKDAFETIVQELDTMPDFIEYLTKRELLFYGKIVIALPGEENDFPAETSSQFLEYSQDNFLKKDSIILSGTEYDLLAYYLKNTRSFPIKSDKSNNLFIQLDGNWNEYISRKEVILKKKYDENSYFIDELVKREIFKKGNEQSEEIAKELFSFDRFDRRIISNNFLQFYNLYENNKDFNFARRYSDFKGTGIVFVFYSPEMDDQLVNSLLKITLDSFCVYSKYKSKKMIIIATTKEFKQFKIGLIKDIKPFSAKKEKQIKEDIKELGWFTNHTEINVSEEEYPEE